jgi:predicted nucleic acid-binding Zn ribbon protein
MESTATRAVTLLDNDEGSGSPDSTGCVLSAVQDATPGTTQLTGRDTRVQSVIQELTGYDTGTTQLTGARRAPRAPPPVR